MQCLESATVILFWCLVAMIEMNREEAMNNGGPAEESDGDPTSVMAHVYACPHCRAESGLDHSNLQPVRDRLLGTEWQCDRCQGWAQIRVAMPDRELEVEKALAAAPGIHWVLRSAGGPEALDPGYNLKVLVQ
jgi:hypothetical protein